MRTERATVITEIILNEEKTERYLYRRTWSRTKTPKLVCVMTIHPASTDPNNMDLTTMLIANSIYEMGYDGFLGVNLSSKLKQKQKIGINDFSEENESVVLEALNDEQVVKIIIAIGSKIKTNREVNSKLKSILGQLTKERRKMVEVLIGQNGPVHPLAPVVRGIAGWKFAKMKNSD